MKRMMTPGRPTEPLAHPGLSAGSARNPTQHQSSFPFPLFFLRVFASSRLSNLFRASRPETFRIQITAKGFGELSRAARRREETAKRALSARKDPGGDQCNRSRRSGFAMIVAIAMLALVSASLLLLTRQFAYEGQRTRTNWEDAQLRQLLLAGAQDVADRASHWNGPAPTEPWRLDLPEALADESRQSASLTAQPRSAAADGIEVRLEARLGHRQAAQTLHLRKASGKWSVTGVTLDG